MYVPTLPARTGEESNEQNWQIFSFRWRYLSDNFWEGVTNGKEDWHRTINHHEWADNSYLWVLFQEGKEAYEKARSSAMAYTRTNGETHKRDALVADAKANAYLGTLDTLKAIINKANEQNWQIFSFRWRIIMVDGDRNPFDRSHHRLSKLVHAYKHYGSLPKTGLAIMQEIVEGKNFNEQDPTKIEAEAIMILECKL